MNDMRVWISSSRDTCLCLCGCREFVQPSEYRWANGKSLDYKRGHDPRSHGEGEKNSKWLGGRYQTDKGYIMVLCKGHPYANGRGYVREHRLIAEAHIGRYLFKGETVHHINFIKLDNRIENLAVMTKSEHTAIHNKLRRRQ